MYTRWCKTPLWERHTCGLTISLGKCRRLGYRSGAERNSTYVYFSYNKTRWFGIPRKRTCLFLVFAMSHFTVLLMHSHSPHALGKSIRCYVFTSPYQPWSQQSVNNTQLLMIGNAITMYLTIMSFSKCQ
jgi:hypothetical protein